VLRRGVSVHSTNTNHLTFANFQKQLQIESQPISITPEVVDAGVRVAPLLHPLSGRLFVDI
jgi:hypothetical protein